jgi:hypothetical protein
MAEVDLRSADQLAVMSLNVCTLGRSPRVDPLKKVGQVVSRRLEWYVRGLHPSQRSRPADQEIEVLEEQIAYALRQAESLM